MILFGGFHEALRSETRWFNDVHLFDFQTSNWTELKHGKLARLPPARSACNMAVCTSPTEALFVSGGYSKVKNANAPGASRSEGIMHVDCWMLPLKSLVAGKGGGGASPPSWERISRKGEYPSARAGTSSVLHRNKMLVFGGVMDDEGDHHKIQSVFYDDLFALDMERRRWFAMRLKKNASGKRRRRKKDGDDAKDVGVEDANEEVEKNNGGESDEDLDDDAEDQIASAKDEEVISSGWDLDQLRHDMFAFIDADGNVVYEKIEEEDDGKGTTKEEGRAEKELTPAAATPADISENNMDATNHRESTEEQPPKSITPRPSASSPPPSKPSGKIAASSVMKVDAKGLPTAVARPTPLPRINCAAVVRNNTLYIYGGVLEVGDREVTLDDCWSIDLNKRDKWTCISAGQMHRQVWKGVDSDNDSYISSDQGADEDDEDSDDDMVESSFEPIIEGNTTSDDNDESKEAKKKAKKAAKKAKEKEKRKGARHEIAELKEKLGVDDERRTPLTGESVADFYARTTEYWNAEAANNAATKIAAAEGSGRSEDAMSLKEVRREGFHLARGRYEELKPILDRLEELESAQAESEEKRASKKKGEKKPKKDRLR